MTVSNTQKAPQKNPTLSIRKPTAEDGRVLCEIAQNAGGLDVNAEYAYLLLGAHFSETCALAEEDGTPAGFVSAYVLPDHPDALFVWQVAVLPEYRKRGLAKKMLKDILARDICHPVHYIQASVTPSNSASQNLFASLAGELGSELKKLDFFKKEIFSGDHEEEFLVHAGPFFQTNKQE